MKRTEIMSLLKEFSERQGFYSRLYSDVLKMDENLRNKWLDQFKDCKDAISLIMMLEG